MLISRSVSKVWEENSFTLYYIPAYHIKKQLKKLFFEIKMYCKQQTIWTNIILSPCLDNWDHFDRVAVNLPFTNSSSLLHTYLECRLWKLVPNFDSKFTCRVLALGLLFGTHIWLVSNVLNPKILVMTCQQSLVKQALFFCDQIMSIGSMTGEFIPKLLLRCGLFAWTRFRLILKKTEALSGL